ncbi:MAG TPA: hypothetical protein VHO84_07550 [Syntrophorhabdaceae bacterium]|nr:hypothetical protein [Syntrophorhabdaceae bacterium]
MSGIFGFIGGSNAFDEIKVGLENLSHRGQESWGIVCRQRDGSFSEARGTGSIIQASPGTYSYGAAGIGQVRYPTSSEANQRNSQPIAGTFKKDKIAIVHNGHIPGYKRMVEKLGGLFQTETDTEVILHMIARAEGSDLLEKMEKTLSSLGRESAFSIIILHEGILYAARDPFGFRPLSIARRGEDDDYDWAVASETCAFHGTFEWITDVEPGTIAVLDGNNIRTVSYASPDPHPCIIEWLDYASPASRVFSKSCYESREHIGFKLGQTEQQKADIVVPIPRAAIPAAVGFHDATGIPFKMAINTVSEIGRVFIISKEKDRFSQAEKKFQINEELVHGREVFLIDSLLVRGSTAMVLIPRLREAGATGIHLRLTAPPPRFPCLMGMAMAKPGELLANNRTDDQLAKLLSVDTFRYVPIEGLRELIGTQFCDACLTGLYPIPV